MSWNYRKLAALMIITCQLAGCTTYYPDADYDAYRPTNGNGAYSTSSGIESEPESKGHRHSLYRETLEYFGERPLIIGGALISGLLVLYMPFWIANSITD